jgi:serine O-acetyltransferase
MHRHITMALCTSTAAGKDLHVIEASLDRAARSWRHSLLESGDARPPARSGGGVARGSIDAGLWGKLNRQALERAAREPVLQRMLDEAVLSRESPAQMVSAVLARRLGVCGVDPVLYALLLDVLMGDARLLQHLEADLVAVTTRDPACRSALHALLHLKGFHALQVHRVAHSLWRQERHDVAFWLSGQSAVALGVDIHPAVPIGAGVVLDHATGIVIGETAVIDDDVSILHGVTLGATGKQRGDRHPKVRRGAVLGAGATVLGNIEVGCMSTVGAGSVVIKPVPAHCTVAGVPAQLLRRRETVPRSP